jgi:hypothetical protein
MTNGESIESVWLREILSVAPGDPHRITIGLGPDGRPFVRCTSGGGCEYARLLERKIGARWRRLVARRPSDPPRDEEALEILRVLTAKAAPELRRLHPPPGPSV